MFIVLAAAKPLAVEAAGREGVGWRATVLRLYLRTDAALNSTEAPCYIGLLCVAKRGTNTDSVDIYLKATFSSCTCSNISNIIIIIRRIVNISNKWTTTTATMVNSPATTTTTSFPAKSTTESTTHHITLTTTPVTTAPTHTIRTSLIPSYLPPTANLAASLPPPLRFTGPRLPRATTSPRRRRRRHLRPGLWSSTGVRMSEEEEEDRTGREQQHRITTSCSAKTLESW